MHFRQNNVGLTFAVSRPPPPPLLPFVFYVYIVDSLKTSDIRTVRGFSLDALEKLSGEKWFDVYKTFWGSPDYADVFTAGACNGTGDWADASFEMRAEGCIKGAQ